MYGVYPCYVGFVCYVGYSGYPCYVRYGCYVSIIGIFVMYPSSIPYGPQSGPLGPGWVPVGPQLGLWECCLGKVWLFCMLSGYPCYVGYCGYPCYAGYGGYPYGGYLTT